jgi:hypothetical protein
MRAGCFVSIDCPTARLVQSLKLQVWVLVIRGDAAIAYFHVPIFNTYANYEKLKEV